MIEIPGWKIDAMEQLLGQMLMLQKQENYPIEELVELVMNPASSEGDLSPEAHRLAIAICLAILIRRMAVVDVPG